ncbi:MAG: S41 family peptidase [Draconibacterium sp.]
MKKLITFLLAGLPFFCSSQVSSIDKKETIANVLEVLEARYIFPEIADSMTSYIKQKAQSGKYDTISTGAEFAFQLTSDLQFISKDLHLKVQFDEQLQKEADKAEDENTPGDKWAKSLMVENNYGIKSKKILDGNIGYLEMPLFGPLNLVADSIRSAIHFIKNTDALILDLRSCRGSLDENTIPFLCSYFFDEPTHLFDFYTRETSLTKQFWTYAWVPGEKYTNKPIYILTSGRTFSGGEELAYDLKYLERAKIVGESTKGGANPTDYVRLNRYYSASVPYMRSINPVTKTNWEHSGVEPDIAVKSNIALYTAHVEALNYLNNAETNEYSRSRLKKVLQEVESRKPEFRIIEFKLKGYENASNIFVAGSFNSWSAKDIRLKRENDYWIGRAECELGEITYKFVVDGRWITDPENPLTVNDNGFENSLIIIQ